MDGTKFDILIDGPSLYLCGGSVPDGQDPSTAPQTPFGGSQGNGKRREFQAKCRMDACFCV